MKPQLYIFEGPDCTGKTTLARRLAYRLNEQRGAPRCAMFKCDGNKELIPAMSAYQESVMNSVEWCMSALGMHYVLDRFWPSEIVYGQVFGRQVDIARAAQLEERCRRVEATYVVCIATNGLTRHEGQRDAAHPYTNDQYYQIEETYRLWASMHVNKAADRMLVYDMDKDGHRLDEWINQNLMIKHIA